MRLKIGQSNAIKGAYLELEKKGGFMGIDTGNFVRDSSSFPGVYPIQIDKPPSYSFSSLAFFSSLPFFLSVRTVTEIPKLRMSVVGKRTELCYT